MSSKWSISNSSSNQLYPNMTTTTTTSTLLTQTISSLSDIYDPRITRPFAFICLLIGSIGNSLSFIVFTQKQLRTHSTFRYLAYLSIVDLIVLYLGLGNLILRDYFLIDIREKNLFLCKFHTFLTYVTTHLSSWILTIVSIDRAIACTVVQLNKRLCRPKSADRIFLIMCIIISLLNSHILLFMGSKQTIFYSSLNDKNISLYKEIIICTHNTSKLYFQFFEKPYNIIDLLSYVLIPFIIMTICAGIIAYRLFFSLSKTTMDTRIKWRARKGTHRAKQISYMLLVLNIVFVALLAPIVIGQIFQELNHEHHYRLYNSITLLLSYSNHALNFVLYGIASPQFRLTLKQLLGFGNNDTTQRRSFTFGLFTSTGF
jgi:MFS family permease